MKKHHIDRLEKLYDFLGTVKPAKFNFGAWGASNIGATDLNVCGTTACALGWAASMPEFRKRGLKLQWSVATVGPGDKESEAVVVLKDKDGQLYNGEDAGREFFGLTSDEADYLFLPKGYGWDSDDSIGEEDMSVKDYRKGLRKFINKKKRELQVA